MVQNSEIHRYDALQDAIERYSPGHTDAWVEVLSDRAAWGYTMGPGRELRSFAANLSVDNRWTVSPIYGMPNSRV